VLPPLFHYLFRHHRRLFPLLLVFFLLVRFFIRYAATPPPFLPSYSPPKQAMRSFLFFSMFSWATPYLPRPIKIARSASSFSSFSVTICRVFGTLPLPEDFIPQPWSVIPPPLLPAKRRRKPR